MGTFQEKLNKFVEGQRDKNKDEAQLNADKFARELQEYVPKERWENVFKYIITYALGIGLGHALAAALVRGADHLAPQNFEVEPLASSIEAGHFDAVTFDVFMTNECRIEDVQFGLLDETFNFDGGVNNVVPDIGTGDVGNIVSVNSAQEAFTSVLGSDLL